MKTLSDVLQEKKNIYHNDGADENSILSAESALGLTFSNDYRGYLLEYGILSYEGHELTGICNSKRLNVVDATQREKKENENITDDGEEQEVKQMIYLKKLYFFLQWKLALYLYWLMYVMPALVKYKLHGTQENRTRYLVLRNKFEKVS